ncbi:MAG: sulfatase-like hydrolase/transferase, partial [SAR324 cluster bacterium]|nr:sulfatase-like hydrolase/transferase [SAR324 cluster bacterium]
ANTRTSLAHTTKAIFAILTGMYPSASQDVAETVYVKNPYRSLPMILKNQMNYRTAFFQSPDGCFESRPSLAHNLGFENFYARQDFADPNQNIGYISYDEFAFIKPITEWIKKDTSPFLLTYMCSVTHDPYTVPPWYGQPEPELIDKYKQTIKYTDKFLETFIKTLKANGLYENTIICILSDHAEGFGEHGVFAHERIGFEEAVRIPCVIKPTNNRTPQKVTLPTSSIDITPTILAMMNVDINNIDFDGANVLNPQNLDRKVFYSGWMQDGPAGYLQKNMKYLYDPESQALSIFNIDSDPFEKYPVVFSVDDDKQREISQEIIEWKQSTIFDIQQDRSGEILLYEKWRCKWNNRISKASHLDEDSFFDRRTKKKLAEKQNSINQTDLPQ